MLGFFAFWGGCVNQFSHDHLLKSLSFPHFYSWFLCNKWITYVWALFFLGSLPCSLYLCFYTNTILFWLLDFIIWFEITKCGAPIFILFLKTALLWGAFVVPHKFQHCFFYFYEKWHWKFDRNRIESVDISG